MESVAVIGAGGMLGYAVSEFFAQRGYGVRRITRKEYDITKHPFAALERLLADVNVVINCAGVIKPQIAANSTEDVMRVNAVFPRNLATFCKGMNIKCFHVTTDCVYSGSKGRYSEDDVFDAEDLYGLSKNAGEPMNCMTLRTSIIGEERGQSRSLVEWARSQQGNGVNGFVNHFWNGVTTLHLAEVIEKIIRHDMYTEGIYHLHSPNALSKKELLEAIDMVYELGLTVRPAEAPQFCDRTLGSIYSFSTLLCTKTIQMQLFEMKEFFELANAPSLAEL
ncbi:MAG: SDR family oxidoreductase [Bacteroidetes bacterium]|nr:MAG: SDR family oxidoreductase [Bacteroidota bacterium]